MVIDGEIKEKFNFKVKPHKDCVIEDEALAIAGVTKEQVLNYTDMDVIYRQLLKITEKYVKKFDKKDKFHLAGFNNASFDNQFFRAFFTQNNDQYFGSWFWANSLDVLVLATQFLKGKRSQMANFQLKTVAAFLGIEVDESRLHDAEYDIDLTMQIYDRVVIKPNEILKDFDLI